MIKEKIKSEIVEIFGNLARFDESMSEYTTFRTGGPADVLISARNPSEVRRVFNLSTKYSLPVFILGGGSNILVGDKGIRGIVLKNDIHGISSEDGLVKCKTGTSLEDLLDFCAEKELRGLEFMSGIYGTVGGAVNGNVGAYGHSLGDFIQSVTYIDVECREKCLDRESMDFSYRKFTFKGNESYKSPYLLLECSILLNKGKSEKIKAGMKRIILERETKMEDPLPSAGCFFKNIECSSGSCGKISAGKLLDEAGVKAIGASRVAVHEKHANIVMNRGGASSSEILDFVETLKRKVKERHGIELEYEVKLVGEF